MRKPTYICAAALLMAALVGTSARAATQASWHVWWGNAAATNGVWTLSSTSPTSPAETHSALVTSAPATGDGTFAFTATTVAQLRTGSAPNPWEVAWAMFRFRDLTHYYWFILKPNGWELGKKQGSDRQIFLATGRSPRLALGSANRVRIATDGGHIRVLVDGSRVVDYLDVSPLPAGGSAGLYEEDSRVQFRSVSVTGQ